MAFNTAEGRAEYTATSGQTQFDFTFKIFSSDQIKVYKTASGAIPNDTTDILTLTTDYTVTINGDNGGTVTLNTGATLNDSIVLVRDLPVTRSYDYQQGGTLTEADLDADQEYQTYLIQQLAQYKDRALFFPDSASNVDTKLPSPQSDYYIRWNTAGTALINDTTLLTAVSQAAASALAASNSASAAAASEATVVAKEALVSPHYTAIDAVYANTTNINTVAGNSANITTVAGISGNVTTVAGNSANVTTVATNISSVNTAATNIAAIIAAPTQASNAATSASNALASENLAHDWATKAHNSIVSGTEYSAYHWAVEAANSVASIGSLDSLSDVVITTPVSDNILKYNGTNWVNTPIKTINSVSLIGSGDIKISGGGIRQTVQYASVDSSGLPNFLTVASTSSITVSGATTNIILNAAGGKGTDDRQGTISANTTITSLSTSATSYLYADIASDGTCTLGGTTVAPVYQLGGTPATTNGLFTFNYGEMKGYLGNGSTTAQSWRVYLGETVITSATTLDPATKGSNITLSNSNLTATGTTNTANNNTYATVIKNSGKAYAEVTIVSLSVQIAIGISTINTYQTDYFPFVSSGYAYLNAGNKINTNSAPAYGSSYTAGDIIGVLYDYSTGALTFYKNGVSQGTAFTLTANTAVYLAVFTSNASVTVNFGATSFAYSLPSGASAWGGSTGIASVVNYALNGYYDSGDFSTTAVSTTKNHNIGVYPTIVQLFKDTITQTSAITATNKTYTWTAASGTSRLIGMRGW